jgi:hypothetical protein
MAQRGFFVIADVSGYSRFLAGSGLEESRTVLRGMMRRLVEQTGPPLKISRILGDAVFSYAPEDALPRGRTLLGMVESMYVAFRAAQEQESRGTSCGCGACAMRPLLDLKIVVHHGEYAVERLGGVEELHGRDVIAAHRLLKNSIASASGIRAWAFITAPAAAAMPIDPVREGMRPHTEAYEHIGRIDGYVHDLAAVWTRERERARVLVGPGDPVWFVHQLELPQPPALVWDRLHDPAHKQAWLDVAAAGWGARRPRRAPPDPAGACVSSGDGWAHVYLDWRPFDYATAEYFLPLELRQRVTFALEATGAGGTLLTVRAAPPRSARRLPAAVVGALTAPVRGRVRRAWRAALARFSAAGHVTPHTAVPGVS